VLTVAGGIDKQRTIPLFASRTLQAWSSGATPVRRPAREVVLWPDTFTNHLTPGIGTAAVEVLEAAGWR